MATRRRRNRRVRTTKLHGAALKAHLKRLRKLKGRKTRKNPRRRVRTTKLYGAALKAHQKKVRRMKGRKAAKRNPSGKIRVHVKAKRNRSGKVVRKAYSYLRKATSRRRRSR